MAVKTRRDIPVWHELLATYNAEIFERDLPDGNNCFSGVTQTNESNLPVHPRIGVDMQ